MEKKAKAEVGEGEIKEEVEKVLQEKENERGDGGKEEEMEERIKELEKKVELR